MPGMGAVTPFYMERSTGQILTQVPLDREYQDKYLLKVKVSSSPVLEEEEDDSSRKRRQTDEIERDTIGVLVFVDDADDNGPSFEGIAEGKIVAGKKNRFSFLCLTVG